MNQDGPRVLHISTSDKLGGVSEVIRSELPYLAELGWRTRWITVSDPAGDVHDAAFVLHNALYGVPVKDFDTDHVRSGVDAFLAAHTDTVVAAAREADVVVLHDPLVLTLAAAVREVAPKVAWRCHIGSAHMETIDRDAITFLRPWLDMVDHLIFSDHRLVWTEWRDDSRVVVVPPGIDPRSWKNRDLPEEIQAPLWSALHMARGARLAEYTGERDARLTLDDFGTGGLRAPDSPFVLQVSRWDPLKGQIGVVRGFGLLAKDLPDIELVLVGPHIDDRRNYPVNRRVWQDLMCARRELDSGIRERVHIWRFGPAQRTGEDLALNVLRGRARTVVQNSRRESFGLTVAEAMWKRAVVVGADVDGISSQIEHGVNGLLTPYTEGTRSWADMVRHSLADEADRSRWGTAAHATVEERYVSRRGVRLQTSAFTGISTTSG